LINRIHVYEESPLLVLDFIFMPSTVVANKKAEYDRQFIDMCDLSTFLQII